MKLDQYVLENKKVIELIKNKNQNDYVLGKYYGTLDYATARFHTILIKLSQDQLLEDKVKNDVQDCFEIIQKFYTNVKRYESWPFFTKPFIKVLLHGIGTRQIPNIKRLLNRVEHQNHFYHHGDDTV
tara:strand:- start:119 stop:499 length:381 start_codon:yes stop_codon:yes gene_type:complete